ncbi:MAG: hypothetical protein BMS9Abin31_1206 [Gammaproteobacteria bacterium]|nr:MAG: hypothetical protein BMS9Abin31_1206 [Gammaproteobacteria bacterium]
MNYYFYSGHAKYKGDVIEFCNVCEVNEENPHVLFNNLHERLNRMYGQYEIIITTFNKVN